MSLYLQGRRWRKQAKGLKSHAMILAKAMDMRNENPSREIEAWDLLASRVRAILHAAATGDWATAESLQTPEGRDTGLVSAEELYRARKEASVLRKTQGPSAGGGADSSSSSDDEGGGGGPPGAKKKRKRPGKKHRKKKTSP